MKIIIVPAQGFGDWIIVNPIVRILSKKYDEVGLVYTSYSIKFLKYMFLDLPNVKFEVECYSGLPNINHIKSQYESSNCVVINLITPGKYNDENVYELNLDELNKPFNRCIYERSGFDWDKNCNEYYIPIDENESKLHHQSLNLPLKYIFLHESSHPLIDRNYILDKTIPIFIPHQIENVFLYKYTIENAEEIHVVDSGFYNFADKLDLKTDKYFMHKTRTRLFKSTYLDPLLNKSWKEIEYLS